MYHNGGRCASEGLMIFRKEARCPEGHDSDNSPMLQLGSITVCSIW